jgi:DNA-binding transcriptional MerR regulator
LTFFLRKILTAITVNITVISMDIKLDLYKGRELDLAALCDAARHLLVAAGIEPGDDRVAAYPDKRTVRYYQSIGLLSKPLRYDGRRAIYGDMHLFRVTCIKLLQAEGHSLAQIQSVIPKATLEQLEKALRQALSLPSVPGDEDRSMESGRVLHSVEVIPGVIITIDPSIVKTPDLTLARIKAALSSGGSL